MNPEHDPIPLPDAVCTAIPSEERSSRYSLVNTGQVLDVLKENDWHIVKAAAKHTRLPAKRFFAKHIVELEHSLYSPIGADQDRLRIHVLNSHDGTSAFVLRLGIFRLICGNGLVVSKGTAAEYRIKHVGFTVDSVQSALDGLLERVSAVATTIEAMRSITLSEGRAKLFALEAAKIRFRADSVADIPLKDVNTLLSSRRIEDRGDTVWTVFNRVQENLLKGGLSSLTRTGKTRRTQGVRSIDEQSRINIGLWDLATSYSAVS